MGEGEEGGGYSLYNTSNYISLKLIQIEEIEEIGVVIQSGGGGGGLITKIYKFH